MKCATKEAQVVYRECFENFAIRTKYIAYKLTKSEELLSHLCCNFHSLRNCLLTKLNNLCTNPKADLAKYLADYTSAIGQEVVAFSCAKYQTIKVCEDQGVVKILKKYKASDVEKWKDEFFLIPLIKGKFESIDYTHTPVLSTPVEFGAKFVLPFYRRYSNDR